MKFGMLVDPVGAFTNLKFQTDRFDGDSVMTAQKSGFWLGGTVGLY